MGLDLLNHAEDLGDLEIEGSALAVEDIPVGVRRLIAIIDQLGISADLAVVA
jgi:hypothetical protein